MADSTYSNKVLPLFGFEKEEYEFFRSGDEGRFSEAVLEDYFARGLNDQEKETRRNIGIGALLSGVLIIGVSYTFLREQVQQPLSTLMKKPTIEKRIERNDFSIVTNKPGKLVYRYIVKYNDDKARILSYFNEYFGERCGNACDLLDEHGNNQYLDKNGSIMPGTKVYLKFTKGPCVAKAKTTSKRVKVSKRIH